MILDPILDLFRGKAVTIPPMDGAFRPNTRSTSAPCFAELTSRTICCFDGVHLLVLQRQRDLFGRAAGSRSPQRRRALLRAVTALALSPSGAS